MPFCSCERKALALCAALALGEGLAALMPTAAGLWPVFALALVLFVLIGHGLTIPGVRYGALVLLGVTLFFFSAMEGGRPFRDRPWMRGRRTYAQQGSMNSVRRDISHRIGLGLAHDSMAANLNRAILLGERAHLPSETKQVFVTSGTMHIFAISGLHVMLVARLLVTLLALTGIPYRWQGISAVPFFWGYVAMIGFMPSAVRAAAMATLYFVAPVVWRRPNGVMAWAITFLAVYGTRPLMIADVGCALSFAVMLSLILAGRLARGLGDGWRMTVVLTFAGWVAGVPIVAHTFGRVTPGGLLANIPILFAAQYSVVVGFLGVLVSFVSETLAGYFNNFSALVTRGMLTLAEVVSRLPCANFETGRWSLLMCVEWYAMLALIFYLVKLRRSSHRPSA